MDIREAALAAIDSMIGSGVIEKAIQAEIEKTVCSVIKSETGAYSDFGKRLTASVKRALVLNDDLDLPSYNDAILKIVRKQVESQTHAVIQQQVAANLKTLLTPAPESITLSALVAAYIDQIKGKQDAGCVCHGDYHEIGFEVRDSDYGFRYISLSETKEGIKDRLGTRHRWEIEIGVNKDGEVFSLRFQDQDVEREMFAGPFYGFERMLFQMKAAGSRIEFDVKPHEIKTTYGDAYA